MLSRHAGRTPPRRLSSMTATATALLVLIAAAGCISGEAAELGRLEVLLTDDPLDEVEAVNVYLHSVAVKPKDGELVIIAEGLGSYDLLQLQERSASLASVTLEPGDYEHVAIELDADRSSVVTRDGIEHPLQMGVESIVVEGSGFTVEAGGRTKLLMDFDVAESLMAAPNAWVMTPSIKITSLANRR